MPIRQRLLLREQWGHESKGTVPVAWGVLLIHAKRATMTKGSSTLIGRIHSSDVYYRYLAVLMGYMQSLCDIFSSKYLRLGQCQNEVDCMRNGKMLVSRV